MNIVPSQASPEAEPSVAASLVVTFLPLVIIFGVFWLFMRVFMRRNTARAEESLRLSREIVTELKAIRAALERSDKT